MRVKNRMLEDKKTGVVYKIPCRDCEHVYVGETKRTLKKQIAKHRQAVRILDHNNGSTVSMTDQAKVVATKQYFWKRKMRLSEFGPMNLDCGLSLRISSIHAF